MTPNPSPAKRHVCSAFVSAVGGCLLGGIVWIISASIMMALVPRRLEGIRNVVDFSWPVYALIPTVAAYTALLLLDRIVRNVRSRFVLITGFAIGVAVCTYCGIDLLRRDYIGKF